MPDIKVRKSSKADSKIIKELAEANDDKIHLVKKKERMFRAVGSVEILVADVDGKFGGFMYSFLTEEGTTLQAGTEEVHVSAIIIHPDFRRLGIASKLVNSLLYKTDKSITAHIDNDNYKAISLFTSLGFSIVDKDAEQVKMQY